jgi:hypothetical protein
MKIKKRLENKMSMYKIVLFLCLTNSNTLALFQAINDVFLKFKNLVEDHESLFQQKLLLSLGLSKDKKATKVLLAKLAYKIGGALHSYAFNNNDIVLMETVHFTESQLRNMRDYDFIEVCKGYDILANDNISNISGYNIDSVVLQTFSAAIALFEDKSPKPIGAIKHGATLTLAIEDKDREITEYLENSLDKAIVNLPDLYDSVIQDYFNSRKITDAGIHHENTETQQIPEELAYFGCNITDTDNNALEEVNVELKSEANTYTDATDEDGDAYIEGIEAGQYILTISLTGKKTITSTMEFISNDEITLVFILEDEEVVPAE